MLVCNEIGVVLCPLADRVWCRMTSHRESEATHLVLFDGVELFNTRRHPTKSLRRKVEIRLHRRIAICPTLESERRHFTSSRIVDGLRGG